MLMTIDKSHRDQQCINIDICHVSKGVVALHRDNREPKSTSSQNNFFFFFFSFSPEKNIIVGKQKYMNMA